MDRMLGRGARTNRPVPPARHPVGPNGDLARRLLVHGNFGRRIELPGEDLWPSALDCVEELRCTSRRGEVHAAATAVATWRLAEGDHRPSVGTPAGRGRGGSRLP